MPKDGQLTRSENLAVTIKYIIELGRPDFKARSLIHISNLDSACVSGSLRRLVRRGYLEVEERNPPRYSVKDIEALKSYYEQLKKRLGIGFERLVLKET